MIFYSNNNYYNLVLAGGRREEDGGNRLKAETGFSYLELVCVLAIIGLITVTSLPSLVHLGSRWKLETAARNVATEFRLAQQATITTRVNTRFEFRFHNNDCRIFYPEGRKMMRLPEGITYNAITFPFSDGYYKVHFTPLGAPSSGGTVALQNRAGGKIYIIVTPATGRVRLSKQPPGNW